jgi:hypothetical protein
MTQTSVNETPAVNEDFDPVPRRPGKQSKPVEALDEASDEAPNDRDNDAGAGASLRISPAEVLRLIMTELTVAPEIAGLAHGIGRNSAYEAIHKGQIVANRVGNKLTCPTAPLRRQLGIDPPLQGAPTPQLAAHPKKQEVKKSPKRQRPRGR